MTDAPRSVSDAEHVRSHYRMYIGDATGDHAAHCLMRDAFCLAIDQALAGTCSNIYVSFTKTGYASIDHDGTSPGVTPETRFDGKSETESIVTLLGVCQRRAAHDYVAETVCRNSFPVVNFLSDQFQIDNYHASGHWSQSFARGAPTTPFHRIGSTDRSGVGVKFKPDESIFPNALFDAADMRQWFDELPLNRSRFTLHWNDQS